MDTSDVYLRGLMFYDFKRGRSATACQDDITAAFGLNIVDDGSEALEMAI